MKKLICLIAALMLIFTACGNNDTDNNSAEDGIVDDGDGIIGENHSDSNKENSGDNIIDDAADGAENVIDGAADGTEDIIDGAADGVKDAADGANDAVRDMTGK